MGLLKKQTEAANAGCRSDLSYKRVLTGLLDSRHKEQILVSRSTISYRVTIKRYCKGVASTMKARTSSVQSGLAACGDRILRLVVLSPERRHQKAETCIPFRSFQG